MFNFNFESQTKLNSFNHELIYDFLVIGGGPAGLNASLYAHRLGLTTAIVTYDIGGQLLNTNEVDNYLGLPNDSGSGLKDKFLKHVENFSIPILQGVYVENISKVN